MHTTGARGGAYVLRWGGRGLMIGNFGFHMTSLKTQTTKLSILPRFYFHDVLGQQKTNFHKNFRFNRVLGFVIEYA